MVFCLVYGVMSCFWCCLLLTIPCFMITDHVLGWFLFVSTYNWLWDPMQANAGPMQANKGQWGPTKAHSSQRRPTPAKWGPTQAYHDLCMFVLFFFVSTCNWLWDPMQANAGPMQANKDPQRPMKAQQRPTKANKGQQRPTKTHKGSMQANKGQWGPTKAHSSQCRPTPAKWGPMQAYNDLGMFFFFIFSIFFLFLPTNCLQDPMQANEGQQQPMQAHKGQQVHAIFMFKI